ncbi:MAG: NifB/NifX family molybdenum-iron cluster-binding protein [Anaerolineales bacterium]
MKIAVITDDGKTISRHFGRAPYYLVLEIKNGEVVNREMRDKLGHSQFAKEDHSHMEVHTHGEGHGHGMNTASHSKHNRMAQSISDCEALICGGMGMGAYQSMQTFDIKPIVTDIMDIEEAVQAYIAGELQDRTDMLH